MSKGNKEHEVKTHIPSPDFKEFLKNLAEDGLTRSEWVRIQIENYNHRKRISRDRSGNVVSLFPHEL